MSCEVETGSTVRIILPPNGYFQAGEEYYVKDVQINNPVILRLGARMVISPPHYEIADKNWRFCRCPNCEFIMMEYDRSTYNPHSVRIKCRNCKEYTIVRGGRAVRYTEKQIRAITDQIKERLISGEYSGVETAVALIAMKTAGKLTETDVFHIIKEVYEGNELEAISTLNRAKNLIDGDVISEIINDQN